MDNHSQPSTGNVSSSRRKSSIFPSFLRNNASSKEALNNSDNFTIDHDPVPSAEFYENTTYSSKSRPTYDDFMNSTKIKAKANGEESQAKVDQGYKLGWINGVYLRTLLNIWGVEMFIRMGWMVGQSGLVVSIFQIILSTAITVITTLSMSAICTNGKIGRGGTYYMISRSLGPEAGACIGTITYFSMCVLNSLNIVGASEGIVVMLKRVYDFQIIDGDINDIRLIGVILLIIIAVIPLFGMSWESKTHGVLFVLLILSLVDYGLGTVYQITPEKQSKGLTGWNWTVIKSNMWPEYQYNENFYTVLAVFFPMVTGIFAGSGMSGDLKDPSTAIPKGTLAAIITSSISYILILLFLGCTFVRYSTGSGVSYLYYNEICSDAKNCQYGLVNDYNTMLLTSLHEFTIYLGIFISAMSSSLACYVAAPRMFQAFSSDNLFPYVSWFGKGHGPSKEPYRGYLITFVISLVFTLVGHLNSIAPIISTFKLASFFLVNLTCFHASYINSPSFRPSFRYYNKWLSLIVGLFCLIFMFFIHFISAIITVIVSLCIFFIVNKRSPGVNWGSTTEDQTFTNSLSNLIRLNQIPNHVKNYRPCILLLSGNPSARMPLVALARDLTKDVGLLLIGQVTQPGKLDPKSHQKVVENLSGWLKFKKIKGFYLLNQSDSLSNGVRNMIQLVGIGKMRPNVFMIGFKSNWQIVSEEELDDYYTTIHTAIEMCLSLVIFRLEHGCDYSKSLAPRNSQLYSIEQNLDFHNNKAYQNDFDNLSTTVTIPMAEVNSDHEDEVFAEASTNNLSKNNNEESSAGDMAIRTGEFAVFTPQPGRTSEKIIKQVGIFDSKQPKGFIDVWWTNDDGGLTLLLPYILSQNKRWNQCKLRVFTVVEKDVNYSQDNLKKLLKQFRIPFSDVRVLTNSEGEPSQIRKQKFKNLVEKFMVDENKKDSKDGKGSKLGLTKDDLLKFKDKTCKILKIRDLIEKNSKNSNMVVMTLPIVSRRSCPASLYLAWLDCLSQEMPPFVFVRGNQSNVLTFYL